MNIEISKLSEEEIEKNKIYSWPIWSCEASEFDWEYADRETCLLLEGQVVVSGDFETVSFGAGDFVVFPKGLKCHWKVIRSVRKHYTFG